MAVTPTQTSFKSLLAELKKANPGIAFVNSDTFYWSPKDKTVYYKASNPHADSAWSLLHELSHALLGHTLYSSDFELLMLEVAAWEKALKLAKTHRITIDNSHVQDCLDTYRDWLHQRSECPTCNMRGFQVTSTQYDCTNCFNHWSVSTARFCRPYRRKST